MKAAFKLRLGAGGSSQFTALAAGCFAADDQPLLAAAATGGRVLLHSADGPLSPLAFGTTITCLAAGRLDPLADSDVLVVGTPAQLRVYDVAHNADVISRQAVDGCTALAVAPLHQPQLDPAAAAAPLVLVGGSCSIYGYTPDGHDSFWTVTGDTVTSMAVLPVTNTKGHNELLVGSRDFSLRVFSGQGHTLHEYSQLESVTHLVALGGQRFGYALANGTVGVYDGKAPLWSEKHKHAVSSITAFDMNSNGQLDLVLGRVDGSLEIRDAATGRSLGQDQLKSPVVGLAVMDFRREGKASLLALAANGNVCGYHSSADLQATAAPKAALAVVASDTTNILTELQRKKKDLQFQIKKQAALAASAAAAAAASGPEDADVAKCQISIVMSPVQLAGQAGHVRITATASAGAVIRALFANSDTLFGAETRASMPRAEQCASQASLTVAPLRNTAHNIDLKLFLGASARTDRYFVREQQMTLPALAMFATDTDQNRPAALPTGCASFALSAPKALRQALNLINQHFLLAKPLEALPLFLIFRNLRTAGRLVFSNADDRHALKVYSDELDTLADVVRLFSRELPLQADLEVAGPAGTEASSPGTVTREAGSLAAANGSPRNLSPREMDGVADRPASKTVDMPLEAPTSLVAPDSQQEMQELLFKVNEFNSVKQKLSAEIADQSSVVKGLVVRAEDYRLLSDFANMREMYIQLHAANRDLMTTYTIRDTNQEELQKHLRLLNQHIQQAAALKSGKSQADFVSGCGEALKNNDVDALLRLLQQT